MLSGANPFIQNIVNQQQYAPPVQMNPFAVSQPPAPHMNLFQQQQPFAATPNPMIMNQNPNRLGLYSG
jgi:hypothetical protein